MSRWGMPNHSKVARNALLAGTGLAALIALAQPAMAQDEEAAEADTAEPSSEGIGEIVVTARYVAESVQDTPMAISAQTGEQLESANIESVADLGAVVPNLYTFDAPSFLAGTPGIVMRGVMQGTDTASFAVPPAVAIYVDEVYHATVAGADLDLTDIERIEVGRGPQSTLSGNASIGGSIRIFTKDPMGDGSGDISLTYGSRNKLRATGAIDLGLSPTLALRVSGSFERQDGYVDLLDFTCQMIANGTPELAGAFPLQVLDSEQRDCVVDQLGGRTKVRGQAKLKWSPTDRLDVLLSASYSRYDGEGTPEVITGINPAPANPAAAFNVFNNAVEDLYGIRYDARFLRPDDKPYSAYSQFCRPYYAALAPAPSGFCLANDQKREKYSFSGRINYELSDAVRMTAIASYGEHSLVFSQSGDASPLGLNPGHYRQSVEQATGEIRFDGSLMNDRLNWVVGGFLIRYNAHLGGLVSFLHIVNFTQDDIAEVESQSGFAHLDFNITDRWRVSGGARYTNGSVQYELDHPGLITVPQPYASKQNRVDWLISTDFEIANDILLYASAASGSRPPGVLTIVYTPEQLGPTPGEELISYEVGVKADLLNNRVRANLAAFYTDYSALSATQFGVQCLGEGVAPPTWYPSSASCASLYPGNPASIQFNTPIGTPATIKGFEWELSALPVDGLRLDWSGGYNKFESSVDTPGVPGYYAPGNYRQPKWNMHANASYEILTSVGTFTPRVDWSWQSKQTFNRASAIAAAPAAVTIEPYSMWNAQVSYEPEDGDWSATLAVNNLFDKFYYTSFFTGTGFNTTAAIAPPREVSLTVRRKF